MRNRYKIPKHCCERKKLFLPKDRSKISNVGSTLTQTDENVGSSTSFSSEGTAPAVILSAKKLKLVVNDSDSTKNEIMLMLPG